jgi:hypothetical protein
LKASGILNLKAGEWVEVRSQQEILATLDSKGALENLPFMPEMLSYCGKRFRVSKRADKTCDNIKDWSIRRMENSVHLEGARCNGMVHGGCEAGCLLFWKEAWLRRIEGGLIAAEDLGRRGTAAAPGMCLAGSLYRACCSTNTDGETIYSCQATELRNYTSYMAAWDIRQYIRDLKSGNLASGVSGCSRSERALEVVLGIMRLAQMAIVETYNTVQRRRHGVRYPAIEGRCDKTPTGRLNLQPGELVQVLSKEEILETLDWRNRNRGLLFDSEMLRYCGGIFRVLRRVYRIIDEKTGTMLVMKNPCIILEGVACQSDYHRFCPRAIYHYWRENWLKRASDAYVSDRASEPAAEVCEKC